MVTRLIVINCIVFVTLVLIKVFSYNWVAQSDSAFYTALVEKYLALAPQWSTVLWRPWTFLTYMFLHLGVWHLAWNMLVLYWFGRIVGDLIGDKKILPLYITGGFAGAIVYLVASALSGWTGGSMLMGASAGVMAIVLAAATTSPDYGMRLLLLGNVKLKYIALAVVVLDILGTTQGNSGGSFAHLGGAIFGFLYVVNLRNGNNLGRPVEVVQEWISDINNPAPRTSFSKPKSKLKVAHRSNLLATKKDKKPKATVSKSNNSVDQILDKIKQQGIGSLTPEEKAILDKASGQ
jgi:membrane associated rhomboid family serine protease